MKGFTLFILALVAIAATCSARSLLQGTIEVPEGCLEWESEKFECFATCEDVEYEVECEVEDGSTEAECYVEDTSSGEKLVEFSCPLNAEMKIECENLSETLNVEMESCLYTSTMKFMDAFVASS